MAVEIFFMGVETMQSVSAEKVKLWTGRIIDVRTIEEYVGEHLPRWRMVERVGERERGKTEPAGELVQVAGIHAQARRCAGPVAPVPGQGLFDGTA